MIAMAILSAFEEFVNDPAGVLPNDAINAAPQDLDDSDLTDPALAWLDDAALPDPEQGCIIAVIDDAIPFAHERLTLPGGVSRVAAFWAQDARFVGGPGVDLPSGTELRGGKIGELLQQVAAGLLPGEDAIYRQTGVLDFLRRTTPSAAYAAPHGAAVALLAAGFAPDDPQARNHPLIAVNLPPKITEDSMGTLAPVSILTSILFIITRARRLCRFIEARKGLPARSVKLPVVINLSFGLTAGACDGSSLLERFMDAVSDFGAPDLGPVHFVLPTGNNRQSRLFARLKPGEDIGWRIQPDDRTITPVEIWGPVHAGPPDGGFQIIVTPPGLAPATTAFTAPWQYALLTGANGAELGRAYYTPRLLQDGTWREGATVIVNPTCPELIGEPWAMPGEWRIGIDAASLEGEYQIAVQRDEVIRGFHREARQSWLHDPAYQMEDAAGRAVLHDPADTASKVVRDGAFNAYAGGARPIRVGAVEFAGLGLSPYCSTLPNGEGGDCLMPVDAAPGQFGMIVRGRGSGAFSIQSGTSLAAPQVAHWLAVRLAAGDSPNDRAAIRDLADSVAVENDPTPVLEGIERITPF